MKHEDYKIEIPGCTDILFFADIKFEGDPDFIHSKYPISGIPYSGKMIIEFYSSDDLSWINDWMEYIYNRTTAFAGSMRVIFQTDTLADK